VLIAQGQSQGMAGRWDHEPTGVRLQTDRDIALEFFPMPARFPPVIPAGVKRLIGPGALKDVWPVRYGQSPAGTTGSSKAFTFNLAPVRAQLVGPAGASGLRQNHPASA